TVGPLRVARVVLEEVAPQHFGDVGHAHWSTRMAAVGFLHSVHAEGTNGVGTFTTAGHRWSPGEWDRKWGRKKTGIFAQPRPRGNDGYVRSPINSQRTASALAAPSGIDTLAETTTRHPGAARPVSDRGAGAPHRRLLTGNPQLPTPRARRKPI